MQNHLLGQCDDATPKSSRFAEALGPQHIYTDLCGSRSVFAHTLEPRVFRITAILQRWKKRESCNQDAGLASCEGYGGR